MFKKMARKVQIAILSVFVMLMLAVPAFAEGTANVAVTGAFTTLKDDVIATLGAVAALAVAVMAIFLAWRYGTKIFRQVAR